jgi:uncharacterized protein
MEIYIIRLQKILYDNNVCDSHGIEHSVIVMNNAKKALESEDYNLNDNQKRAVILAALLHDADDRKFFPNNKNFENLISVLEGYDSDFINLVIKMVDLVSSSKNGDNIPDGVAEWMLIPRYSDRLEAIGKIGIKRCYQFGITTKNPLYTENTKRLLDEKDLFELATEERYKNYKGYSDSMIDHYYDKLLRATFFPIKNEFFDYESNKRRKPLIDFLIYFSKNKTMCNQNVEDFIANYKLSFFNNLYFI